MLQTTQATGKQKKKFIGSSSQCSTYDHQQKPPYSYVALIATVLTEHPEKKMTLNDIYKAITKKWPYFQNQSLQWQNSIRHNLSLNDCFKKVPTEGSEKKKGNYWTLDSNYSFDEMFEGGNYQRRRRQKRSYDRSRSYNTFPFTLDQTNGRQPTAPPIPKCNVNWPLYPTMTNLQTGYDPSSIDNYNRNLLSCVGPSAATGFSNYKDPLLRSQPIFDHVESFPQFAQNSYHTYYGESLYGWQYDRYQLRDNYLAAYGNPDGNPDGFEMYNANNVSEYSHYSIDNDIGPAVPEYISIDDTYQETGYTQVANEAIRLSSDSDRCVPNSLLNDGELLMKYTCTSSCPNRAPPTTKPTNHTTASQQNRRTRFARST